MFDPEWNPTRLRYYPDYEERIVLAWQHLRQLPEVEQAFAEGRAISIALAERIHDTGHPRVVAFCLAGASLGIHERTLRRWRAAVDGCEPRHWHAVLSTEFRKAPAPICRLLVGIRDRFYMPGQWPPQCTPPTPPRVDQGVPPAVRGYAAAGNSSRRSRA